MSANKPNPFVRYAKEFFTKKNAKRKFPIASWIRDYRGKHFVGDLVAGLTVGLTVIPQGLAYALVAELPPQYGLYSAFMGVFIYAFLGSSKDITLGPTAIMSLLVAEFGSERSPIHNDPTYAIILTMFCGLIQLVMGLLNMGFIIQFISFPVVSGFTSAAAILIAFSQVRKWLGLKNVPRNFLPQVEQTFQKLPDSNLQDFFMGLACLIVLMLMKKLKEKVDARMKTTESKGAKAGLKFVWLICTARNAVIVCVTAVIAYVLHDVYQLRGLSLTGEIEAGMPFPSVPKFTLTKEDPTTNQTVTVQTSGEVLSTIAEGFAVVSLVGILESIAIAKAFARKNEYKIDPSQELIALGVANFISSFFHSYPVTGSFSRTAINSQSGVRTPLGGIWTGLLVVASIFLLTPYFYYIPQAALAAVIIAAVIQMVEYEAVIELWKVKKLDLLPLATTFFLSVFVNFEVGIMAGVGLSCVMCLYPMARPGLKVTYLVPVNQTTEDKQVCVLELRQGLKFPGIEYLKDKIMKHGVYEDPQKPIVVNAAHFSGCDFSMVQGIAQVVDYFSKHKLTLIFAEVVPDVKEVLDKAKIKNLAYADTVHQAVEDILSGPYMVVSADTNGTVYSNGGYVNDDYENSSSGPGSSSGDMKLDNTHTSKL